MWNQLKNGINEMRKMTILTKSSAWGMDTINQSSWPLAPHTIIEIQIWYLQCFDFIYNNKEIVQHKCLPLHVPIMFVFLTLVLLSVSPTFSVWTIFPERYNRYLLSPNDRYNRVLILPQKIQRVFILSQKIQRVFTLPQKIQ